jgi:NAD(P)-dependent dehydrogenase (short-subunit alcohol dehydrogenase family)
VAIETEARVDRENEVFGGGVAVITGAASGIGEGLARHAAALGMKVVLADIAAERLEAVAADICATGAEALAVPTDVSDPAALERLASVTHATFGDVRLLVNNAGIETLGFVWEIPAATWEKTLAINIHGAIHGVRAFAPRMIAAGKPAFIANTSSIGGLGMMPVQASYILSKHATLSFSECLRLEMLVKKAPIQVSAILPGPVATRIFEDSRAEPDPITRHHREVMRAMLEKDGISGLEAARRILKQIAAGEFWVSTHPEITAFMAGQRAEYLATQAMPQLPPGSGAMLGTAS